MKSLPYFLLVTIIFILNGCSSVTKQSRKTTIMDVSQEDTLGGTGTSSADIRSMAERMAREISGIEWPHDFNKVRVALTTIDNQTRFPINPNIIKDRLLADLVEFSMGTKLQFTENANGADYFLSARLTALSKGSSEGVSDYLLYSFKLIDKADTVVWMKAYETKKQGSVGVMYR
ncbi:MAG: hypothetical protein BWZ03_00465 [bacterium ADurb.BinA186]|nr:MAG: hypothetical protein BWZ03_00465 [bacterium ADurb.BinA186]